MDELEIPDGPAEVEASPAPVRAKRHKKHGAGHHGGAWKVAYADFITTMMALFLLLWLLNASDNATRNMIAMYFRDPGIFDNQQGANIFYGAGIPKDAEAIPIPELLGPGPAGQGGSPRQFTLERLKGQLDEVVNSLLAEYGSGGQIKIVVVPEGLLVEIMDANDRPLFNSGSSDLSQHVQFVLEQMGMILSLVPDFAVSVSGHTDNEPFPVGTVYSNWDLSLDRAQQAARLLQRIGVPAGRIRSIAGYADTRPLKDVEPSDPHNRRLSLLISEAKATALEEHEPFPAGPEHISPDKDED